MVNFTQNFYGEASSRCVITVGHKQVSGDITVVLLTANDRTGRTMLEGAEELDSGSNQVAEGWFTQ